jgi:2-desacetyl-2-hydroxyethyl bacteriochlorophyllide A dehydrogenase
MQGLWIDQGSLELRDNLQLIPEGDEQLVRVRMAGICGTDLELLRGYYGFAGVPGHEFVGEIVSPGTRQGQRVVADINFGCGHCEFCHQQDEHHCLHRRTLGINQAAGAFAEYLLAPDKNLLTVPDTVPDEHAVFAEPLAAALQILEQVPMLQQHVLLVGAGRLGRMIAWVIARLKPEVNLHVAVRSPQRAKQLPDSARLLKANEIAPEFDIAIDCTGNADGFAMALNALKAKGTLVVKSTYADQLQLDMSRVVVDEIRIVGSRCGPMAAALQFLKNYPEVFRSMRRQLFPLQDFNEAFNAAQNPSIDKVLFQFQF